MPNASLPSRTAAAAVPAARPAATVTDIARTSASSPARRFYELDSLRGLAAATVVLHHFAHFVPARVGAWFGPHSPLQLLTDGHQAVLLFFVLSGFVLTLPYLRRAQLDYPAFLLKRLCRIYLPYLAALALAIAGNSFSAPYRSADPWANLTWTQPISTSSILQHILFLGSYDQAQYNTAFWSLVQEMRISLIFPLLALAVLRWRASVTASCALALWPLSLLVQRLLGGHLPASRADDLSDTVFYISFFLLGALLARNLPRLNASFGRLSPAGTAAFALAALFLYGYTGRLNLLRHLPLGIYDWLAALGAAGLIVLAVNADPVQRFLTSRAVHHLGKISYSLYLVHGTVLFALVHAGFTRLPFPAALGLYLALTLLVTEVFYRLVERPTIRLGRRLTSRPRLERGI